MKLLINKNIVSGAGLGHTLSCYNYGLKMALDYNYEYYIAPFRPGHNLNSCFDLCSFFNLNILSENKIFEYEKEYDFVQYSYIRKIDNLHIVNEAPLITKETSDFILNNKDKNIILNYNKIWSPALDNFSDTLSLYKKSFNKYNFINENKLIISIHIRRNDVLNCKNRVVKNQEYEFIVNEILQILQNFNINLNNIVLNIFSDGNKKTFIDEFGKVSKLNIHLKDSNIFYYINTNPYQSLIDMISSDILIGGPSGYFRTASMFTDALCISINCGFNFNKEKNISISNFNISKNLLIERINQYVIPFKKCLFI